MIPFAKPSFKPEMIDEMFSLFRAAIESGMLTNSENVREVEQIFEKSLGIFVAATNSCTASLHLAMMLAGVHSHDEVILPSDTFVSTANAVLYCGGKPVFAEIEEDSWTLSPNSILESITHRTKVIIPVHLGGIPCNMDAINEIAEDHHLIVVEDCAHAHGALFKEQPCGSFGKMSCFSFYPTKVIASAEGGLICCREEDIVNKARVLINQGRKSSGPSEITDIGYNYRMNELQAIMIRVQLKYLSDIIKLRTKIVNIYNNNLKNEDTIRLVRIPPLTTPSYYSYSILVNKDSRDEIVDRLREKGIGTSIMYHPVHLQPVYRKIFGYKPGDLPVTEDICSRTISLPLHLNLTATDIKFICQTIVDCLD